MRSTVLLGALLCVLTIHRTDAGERPIPPGLQRIMAEGSGRVANYDVRRCVGLCGALRGAAGVGLFFLGVGLALE
jgi:hypothetical protein